MAIDALAHAYDMPVEAVVDLAVRNLTVLAAYQMGVDGASAERVYALLLAPPLQGATEAPPVPVPGPQTAPEEHVSLGAMEALTTAQSGPGASDGSAWPDVERAPMRHRRVLRAASRMTKPFLSRELAALFDPPLTGASVGGILSACEWPSETPRVGYERRWLPRPVRLSE